MGLKFFSICLKIDVLKLLREVKHPFRIVLFYGSPYNLIDVWQFFSLFATIKLKGEKVKFTDTSSAGRRARKITNYFDLSVFNWDLSHSNLCSTDGCCEFSKVGFFSWLTRYFISSLHLEYCAKKSRGGHWTLMWTFRQIDSQKPNNPIKILGKPFKLETE